MLGKKTLAHAPEVGGQLRGSITLCQDMIWFLRRIFLGQHVHQDMVILDEWRGRFPPEDELLLGQAVTQQANTIEFPRVLQTLCGLIIGLVCRHVGASLQNDRLQRHTLRIDRLQPILLRVFPPTEVETQG